MKSPKMIASIPDGRIDLEVSNRDVGTPAWEVQSGTSQLSSEDVRSPDSSENDTDSYGCEVSEPVEEHKGLSSPTALISLERANSAKRTRPSAYQAAGSAVANVNGSSPTFVVGYDNGIPIRARVRVYSEKRVQEVLATETKKQVDNCFGESQRGHDHTDVATGEQAIQTNDQIQ